MQQGDVKLFQTNDDGDILIENGLVEMSGGLDTSLYLSMFGGNDDDPATSDTSLEWWGNKSEDIDVFKYRSETQYILASIPTTSSNMLKVKASVERDLAWFISEGVADKIEIEITIPALNRVCIELNVNKDGRSENFKYIANWKAE